MTSRTQRTGRVAVIQRSPPVPSSAKMLPPPLAGTSSAKALMTTRCVTRISGGPSAVCRAREVAQRGEGGFPFQRGPGRRSSGRQFAHFSQPEQAGGFQARHHWLE